MSRRAIIFDWAVMTVVLAVATAWLRLGDTDLALQSRFFVPGEGWPTGGEQPWRALYRFGVIPAWIISLSALGLLVASVWKKRLAPARRTAWFLVLVMAVGPGLVVNDVFKKHWGRPRPKDVVTLGGEKPFLEVWEKGPNARWGNSFASGHAATAFYVATPFFLLRRSKRRRALVWLLAGLTYGALMGVARMAQGAHFLSDIVWAAGFVWIIALVFFYALRLHRNESPWPRTKTPDTQ